MSALPSRPARGARRLAGLTVMAAACSVLMTPTAAMADPTPAPSAKAGDVDAARALAPCDPNGPTSTDSALATQLNGTLRAKMRGYMSAYRVSCARMIIEAVRDRGLHPRAAVIAVTTTIVESSIDNISEELDHDSLGLFQQRASWGTRAQRLNPTWATNAFLNKMLSKYPNNRWMTEPIGEICQAVQVSAYPDRYQPQAGDAQIIVDAISAASGPPTLGVLDFFLSDDQASNEHTRPVISYGNSPMVPIVGDWDGDGSDTPSAYNPVNATFYISSNPATGQAQYTLKYGNANSVPLVGDWDGDGKDNIGVRMGNTFYMRTSPVTSATETTKSIAYGDGPMTPLIGDWDGDGSDTPSAYNPANATFYISNNPATGQAQYTLKYGNANSVPLVGDWDGDGKDNIGVRMDNTFYMRTSPVTSATETTKSIAYGGGADLPVIGDWNGDGTDSQGIVR
ncbi:hypothetical protein GCM10022226_47870 [Sphaerisporangium flaviroseum]|uniref:VCBS repeat-containing protein n=1 Tax=Sphaerisporangium flaviroseum TaxID=509199 RepID=A0ABP7IMG8_9ACTN